MKASNKKSQKPSNADIAQAAYIFGVSGYKPAAAQILDSAGRKCPLTSEMLQKMSDVLYWASGEPSPFMDSEAVGEIISGMLSRYRKTVNLLNQAKKCEDN